jgi:hypothetical protein
MIAARFDLELVGVWVQAADKVGRDAGEVAGIAPLGVVTTSDADALLALVPDCVCYTASGESRPDAGIDDFCRILEAGANVVTTSIPGLVHPAAFDTKHARRLEAACQEGRSSLYTSGIEPGFAGDQPVLTLATLAHRIRSVRTQEILSYAGYPVAFTMFDVFGFGKPADHRCILQLPGVQTATGRMGGQHVALPRQARLQGQGTVGDPSVGSLSSSTVIASSGQLSAPARASGSSSRGTASRRSRQCPRSSSAKTSGASS